MGRRDNLPRIRPTTLGYHHGRTTASWHIFVLGFTLLTLILVGIFVWHEKKAPPLANPLPLSDVELEKMFVWDEAGRRNLAVRSMVRYLDEHHRKSPKGIEGLSKVAAREFCLGGILYSLGRDEDSAVSLPLDTDGKPYRCDREDADLHLFTATPVCFYGIAHYRFTRELEKGQVTSLVPAFSKQRELIRCIADTTP